MEFGREPNWKRSQSQQLSDRLPRDGIQRRRRASLVLPFPAHLHRDACPPQGRDQSVRRAPVYPELSRPLGDRPASSA